MKHLNRTDKWTVVGVMVAVISVAVAVFLPEIRRTLRLEKPDTSITAGVPSLNPVKPETIVNPPKTQTTQAAKSLPGKKSIRENTDNGHADATKNNNQETVPAGSPVQINAPNGIAIVGGVVNNPTVNNFGSAPEPPLPVPTVKLCVAPSSASDGQYTTNLIFRTDVKIEQPWYGVVFDGPVTEGKVEVEHHGFVGFTQGKADKLPTPENTLAVKLTSIDFNPAWWLPSDKLTIRVASKNVIRIVRILGGSGDASDFKENLVLACDQ